MGWETTVVPTCDRCTWGKALTTTQISGQKGLSLDPVEPSVYSVMHGGQYFHLTYLQLQIKVYICAHSNILSLELTINSTFDWICLTILIATLSLTLLETSLSLWNNLDVRSPIFISEIWKGNGRTDKRNIYRVPTQATHTLMDSPATSAWSSSSRFRTQRRKQLVPCRWAEYRLSPTYFL